ncbi:MAG: glutathione S-transferase family protein [Hyphomonadaceae bacterium]|nr:MAG: glutathione S-transferase [Caulobacteraceae bacterium]MBT9444167.1 glutathione S-transferase family protein [Hyphomonadaceae bacterium]TPW04911.1 MAG: glutathione S-transferase [Alphaproteobacteria bacterium]
MARYKLHGIWASGPTYKVALMLTLCGQPFDYEHVDMMTGAHKAPEYLAKNRFGQVPCLEDSKNDLAMCQSSTILEYIAEQTGQLLPPTQQTRQQAREWVFWAWDRLARGVYRPRAIKLGFLKAAAEIADHYLADGAGALKALDEHLTGREWLVGDAPSFADIDLYGVVAYAGQGGHLLNDVPSVEAWMQRIERLPGFKDVNTLLPKESRAA